MRPPLAAIALVGLAAVAAAQEVTTVSVSTGLILLKDDTVAPIDLGNRYVKWKVRTKLDPVEHQVAIPAPGSAGDPTMVGATFAVYNTAGSGETVSVDLAASRWLWTGGLYTYTNPAGPILAVYVRPYKLYVRGAGAGWGYTLDEPAQGTMGVRLRLGTAIEWCGEAPGRLPANLYDRPDKFWSAKSAAPATCAALPGP